MGKIYKSGPVELRCGDWREVLADVEADAFISDPPYSERTHAGHDDGAGLTEDRGYRRSSDGGRDRCRPRSVIAYDAFSPADVTELIDVWHQRVSGWMVALTDSELCPVYRSAYERNGRIGFQPVGVMIPGMTVRLCGDGPSSWLIYASVGRPKSLARWGTLPGGYNIKQERAAVKGFVGFKPVSLMRALIRDYTRPGDLIVDPYAGTGTTLLAAAIEGRRAIGAELNPETFEGACRRLSNGHTPDLFAGLG